MDEETQHSEVSKVEAVECICPSPQPVTSTLDSSDVVPIERKERRRRKLLKPIPYFRNRSALLASTNKLSGTVGGGTQSTATQTSFPYVSDGRREIKSYLAAPKVRDQQKDFDDFQNSIKSLEKMVEQIIPRQTAPKPTAAAAGTATVTATAPEEMVVADDIAPSATGDAAE